jgi:ATP-grasp domain, R2K clade family 3
MHWILQEGFHNEAGWEALIDALERFDLPYSVHHVIPAVGVLVPEPQLTHANVICIGSYSMRHAAARNGWKPGVFDLVAHDFDAQHAHWGEHMLNAGSTVSTIQEARFVGDRMFVRPSRDTKQFSGRVFSADEFGAWRSGICDPAAARQSSLSPDTEVQLSRPVSIQAEYRCWVVGGEIVTQSLYRRGRQVVYSSDVDERVTRFVEHRLAEWLPHEAFVIDACDSELGMKIVELNTLNASAFYAADLQRLVTALEGRFSA